MAVALWSCGPVVMGSCGFVASLSPGPRWRPSRGLTRKCFVVRKACTFKVSQAASFKPGNRCWVHDPKGGDKHKTLWLGPCNVRKVEGRTGYLVQVSETHSRSVHRDQIRAYYAPSQGKPLALTPLRARCRRY